MSQLLWSLFTRSDREQIAIDFFKKEQNQWLARDSSKLLSRREKFARKKRIFVCFWKFFTVFPLFYAQERIPPHYSLLSCSFLKRDGSDLLLLFFKIERPWVNRSHRSLQKSDHEWFAPVAHGKRAMGAICSFLWANHSDEQIPDEQIPTLTVPHQCRAQYPKTMYSY